MSQQTKVFISHTLDDRAFAEDLSRVLGGYGITTLGPWEFSTNSAIEDDLRRALFEADTYVVLVSEDSLRSPWLNFEIGAAVGGKKKVVFVYLTEGAQTTASEPMRRFPGIEASALRPEEVADRLATMVQER